MNLLAKGVGLASRRVLRIAGDEALPLLQRVLTNDVRPLARPGAAPVYAALQNAQGRIEHDVFLHRAMSDGSGGGGDDDASAGASTTTLFADFPADGFDDALSLLKKLRMRAKVTFEDVSDDFKVVATAMDDDASGAGGGDRSPDDDERGLTYFSFLPLDPRWPGLGLRGVVPAALLVTGSEDHTMVRP